jgi:carotenoid cleavage dioxygenase-like enzyme
MYRLIIRSSPSGAMRNSDQCSARAAPSHSIATQLFTGHGEGPLDAFDWMPSEGTRFTVVRLSDGEIVGRYLGEAFFAYHHVNAFEREEGGRKQACGDSIG